MKTPSGAIPTRFRKDRTVATADAEIQTLSTVSLHRMKPKPSLAEQREIQRQPLANFADAANVKTTPGICFLIGAIVIPDDFD